MRQRRRPGTGEEYPTTAGISTAPGTFLATIRRDAYTFGSSDLCGGFGWSEDGRDDGFRSRRWCWRAEFPGFWSVFSWFGSFSDPGPGSDETPALLQHSPYSTYVLTPQVSI